jgi:hypothetical protein
MPESTPRRSKCHEVKSWPDSFVLVARSEKTFEIRQNDRGYHVGDYLLMHEWDPATEQYTGRAVMARITYLTQGKWGMPANLCAMQVEVVHYQGIALDEPG